MNQIIMDLTQFTGVTQIVTTKYPGMFTVGCLLMQSYFSAIGVLCMLTMVRELWWLATTGSQFNRIIGILSRFGHINGDLSLVISDVQYPTLYHFVVSCS